eukprot:501454-Alexandrium_andersonii.AAC.1
MATSSLDEEIPMLGSAPGPLLPPTADGDAPDHGGERRGTRGVSSFPDEWHCAQGAAVSLLSH